MEYPNYKGVEYNPGKKGIAVEVKCPLVNSWIEAFECVRTRENVNEQFGWHLHLISEEVKKQKNWKQICMKCPFQNY